jgi:hypothetical protein
MPTKISRIEELSRQRLIETTPRFWSSAELTEIIITGIRDLWRDIVDLKQEHYLHVNTTDVFYAANSDRLTGVPADVHKIYLIESLYHDSNDPNVGLIFTPQDYNSIHFQMARGRESIDPKNDAIYYAITGQGAPVNAPIVLCAPPVTSLVQTRFCYVPTLGDLTTNDFVPIPGEADNALVAWTVAFAHAKEREDRAPDSNWLSIYQTEKSHLLQSLGLRQYQEPSFANAMFEQYWA